jgi:hypothetical protein
MVRARAHSGSGKIMPRDASSHPTAGRPGRPSYPGAGRPGYRPVAGYPGCYYGYRAYGAAGAVGGPPSELQPRGARAAASTTTMAITSRSVSLLTAAHRRQVTSRRRRRFLYTCVSIRGRDFPPTHLWLQRTKTWRLPASECLPSTAMSDSPQCAGWSRTTKALGQCSHKTPRIEFWSTATRPKERLRN